MRQTLFVRILVTLYYAICFVIITFEHANNDRQKNQLIQLAEVTKFKHVHICLKNNLIRCVERVSNEQKTSNGLTSSALVQWQKIHAIPLIACAMLKRFCDWSNSLECDLNSQRHACPNLSFLYNLVSVIHVLLLNHYIFANIMAFLVCSRPFWLLPTRVIQYMI